MTDLKDQRPILQERLIQKMSEVISLREKVAQAERAARKSGPPPEQRDELAGSKK
jgi:hypothetical protein